MAKYYKGDIIVEEEAENIKGRALLYYVNRPINPNSYKIVKRPIINHFKALMTWLKIK